MKFQDLIKTYNYRFENNVLLFQRGPLSNWYGSFRNQESPIAYDILTGHGEFERHEFNCSEQLIMALKAELFEDWETLNKILLEKSAKMQQELGRQVKGFNSEVWDKEKYNVYSRALYEKFTQNKELLDSLLNIPPCVIICEAAPWDKVWGNGLALDDPRATDVTKWQGENLLGQVLMNLRGHISRNAYRITTPYNVDA